MTGGQQSAAAGDGGYCLGLVAGFLESAGDHLGAVLEAGDHGTAAEARQFFVAVADGAHPGCALAGVEAELGGGGTGIDGQDLAARVLPLAARLGWSGNPTASPHSEDEFTPVAEADAGAAVTGGAGPGAWRFLFELK